ncbi:hypothetical protein MF406_08960 [Georgenia sp. TF02-10]|uniref:hypothetical protein n=1 Tax=Georgenia sp. TF02-10 TaxID=2917725 RepID=UPI001FA6B495|nr:hypothetical protein [Georgenia sp. TF02-10]UNX53167.1 hypothetical protein MF406_08960 [Georgenia sp. TF02-10]
MKTHWFNGWFLRLFSRPYLVIDGEELATRWGKTLDVPLSDGPVRICAGVRYFRRDPLLGCRPETLNVDELSSAADHDSGSSHRPQIVFRNGFWNHSPFRVVR